MLLPSREESRLRHLSKHTPFQCRQTTTHHKEVMGQYTVLHLSTNNPMHYSLDPQHTAVTHSSRAWSSTLNNSSRVQQDHHSGIIIRTTIHKTQRPLMSAWRGLCRDEHNPNSSIIHRPLHNHSASPTIRTSRIHPHKRISCLQVYLCKPHFVLLQFVHQNGTLYIHQVRLPTTTFLLPPRQTVPTTALTNPLHSQQFHMLPPSHKNMPRRNSAPDKSLMHTSPIYMNRIKVFKSKRK
mmetsp:Transcript_11356/g.42618  ORF Transcript_11356/g.42618 Transcript_11356/m.42618 type:complete len:238 (+) Transcript_11356:384-1097(+)